MRRCVGEKVAQVEGLADFLCSTGDATIAACSPRDRYWGNGCDPMSLSRLVPSEWPGKNVLGSILEDLRAALSTAEKDAQPAAQPRPEPDGETDLGATADDSEAVASDEVAVPAVGEGSEGSPAGSPAPTSPGSPSPEGEGPTAAPPSARPLSQATGEGALLKRLVVRYLGNLTADNLDRLVSGLSAATVVVPVTPVAEGTGEPDGTPDPEARFAFERDGRRVRPNVLQNEQGQRWFAVFTGADEVPGAASGEQETVELPMTECVEMARTRGDALGIIVNAFSDCLTLTPETCLRIAEVARRGLERPLEA